MEKLMAAFISGSDLYLKFLGQRRTSLAIWVLVVLFLIPLSGCETLISAVLKEPNVQLSRVSVRDSSVRGATLVLALKVDNPNAIALSVDELRYKVELAGQMIADSQSNKEVSVPANGSSEIEIPLAVKYEQLISSLQILMAGGTTQYKVTGDAKMGLFRLPFIKAGSLQLKGQ
jgi:LEA14-like dessication related protein